MGKILKAEFTYNMTGILIGYSIVFIALLMGLNGGMENIYGIIAVAFVTFFISIGVMGSESDKEKRDRFLTSLPIPLKLYSIIRLLFVIFYVWLCEGDADLKRTVAPQAFRKSKILIGIQAGG